MRYSKYQNVDAIYRNNNDVPLTTRTYMEHPDA